MADAAAMAGLTIYNMPPMPAVWDSVGIFYICFACIWTTIVLAGMAFCVINRHNPVIRVRGIALSFSAILLLHVYWICAQIVYPIGRTLPTVLAYDIQYFAMGIYFPLGIALFHASNLRFLRIAKLQKRFVQDYNVKDNCDGADSSSLCRLRNLNYTLRIMLFIGVGMVLQMLLTIGMWLACAKYHPTFGISGTEIKGDNVMEQIIDLGRGWEWWPSVLWQVIWTWIVAPILLWRAWGIRDTMGWRTQTIGVCLSNLHATPMFLAASYAPAFTKINMYYAPSQWIHLSIMFFEIFTVFVPVVQVIRQKSITKKAIASNSKWETASQTSTVRSSSTFQWRRSTPASVIEKGHTVEQMNGWAGDRLFTMAALDHVLAENPIPLQDYSAIHDFSGENIAFLTKTMMWKASCVDNPTEEQLMDSYNQALEIYTEFISPQDAQFPLNISSQSLRHLKDVFERAARILNGEGSLNSATPFDSESSLPSTRDRKSSGDISAKVRYTGEIPFEFDAKVYDEVQSHVKYLVLTNTWPKFVEEMQQRRRSLESERSDWTDSSERTFASRMSNQLAKLIPGLFKE